MRQTDPEKIKQGRALIEELIKERGGALETHRKMANDPRLLGAFLASYKNCETECVIPKKYHEMIVMAIGVATGSEQTIRVHGNRAIEAGATMDEIGEVLRILLFTVGVTKVNPAMILLEELPEE